MREAAALGLPALAELVTRTASGIAVVDGGHHLVYANPAACEMLGNANEVSREGEFLSRETGDPSTYVMFGADGNEREVVCSVFPVDVVGLDHKIAAVGAYSSPGYGLPPVSGTSRAAAWKTLGDVPGAEIIEAMTGGSIIIDGVPGKPVVLPDARSVWEASALMSGFASTLQGLDWQAGVFVPLSWENRTFGVLGAYLPSGLARPSEAELAFYTALADQAAVAVTNVWLTSRARRTAASLERTRLARELHDSVSQALFSMTMHTRAAQLSMAKTGSTPADRWGVP